MSLQTRLGSLITAIGADIKVLKNGGSAPPLVASLPTVGPSGSGGLVNGQECYYIADATNGVIWHLVYKTSNSKWHYIGGPPLFDSFDTRETTASTTFANLATQRPTLTIPIAGTYMIEIGAQSDSTVVGQATIMSYKVGAAAALEADSAWMMAGGAVNAGDASKARRKTCAAADVILAQYRTGSGTAGFRQRSMRITPVMLG